MSRRAWLTATVGLALAAAACAPHALGEGGARAVLSDYFDAVQDALEGGVDASEAERLAGLLVGCAEDGVASCRQRVEQVAESVASQREAGHYDFEHPWGFGLVRALVLGRGGYWSVRSLESEGDEAVVRLRALTQYDPDETIGLPERAVVEYLGRPLGHVERVPRGGGGPGTLRWHLVAVEIDARLVRRDGEWRVAGLDVLPETAEHEQVTWRPK